MSMSASGQKRTFVLTRVPPCQAPFHGSDRGSSLDLDSEMPESLDAIKSFLRPLRTLRFGTRSALWPHEHDTTVVPY